MKKIPKVNGFMNICIEFHCLLMQTEKQNDDFYMTSSCNFLEL
jgi:hypothetical protein